MHGKRKEEIATLETRLEALEQKNSVAKTIALSGGPELQQKLALYEQHMKRLEELIPKNEEVAALLNGLSERAMDTLTRYCSPDSPYAGLLRRADLLLARSDAHAVGPECVARAIARAIDARRPAARYIAPLRARALLMVALALPTVILDAIIRASAGLTRARLLPRATTSKAQPAPRALAS